LKRTEMILYKFLSSLKSWRFLTYHKVPRLLQNPNALNCTHNSLPLIPNNKQINTVRILTFYSFQIRFNNILQSSSRTVMSSLPFITFRPQVCIHISPLTYALDSMPVSSSLILSPC
jgi:hypothetical protein